MRFPRFTIENLADLVAEYTQDGKRKRDRDVLDWFRWLERKFGIKESLIQRRRILLRMKAKAKRLTIEPKIVSEHKAP